MRHLLVPVVLAAFVVGACTPAVEEPTTAPPPSPTVSVSASPSPTPEPSPSPTVAESFPPAPASESADQAAVRAAWMEYWRVHDKFTSDPTLSDLTETQNITTGDQMNLILDSIAQLRERKLRSLGGFGFRDVVISPAETTEDGRRAAVVEYCLDRRGLRLQNFETGEEVPVQGAPTYREQTTLKEGADGRWRVAEIRNQEATC